MKQSSADLNLTALESPSQQHFQELFVQRMAVALVDGSKGYQMSYKMTDLSVDMLVPAKRNMKFYLPLERVGNWNAQGLHVTVFLNVLSIFFPLGEQFFIRSVCHYKDKVPKGSPLEDAVSSFVSQEAFHSREHELYNAAVATTLPRGSLAVMEAIIDFALTYVPMGLPNLRLGGTVALEHLTALLGHSLLTDVTVLDGAEEHYRQLWLWHALEETEHKAVTWDVHQLIFGAGYLSYLNRMFCFVLANLCFWPLLALFYVYAIWQAGGLFDLQGWRKVCSHMFGSGGRGMLRRVLPEYLDYFRFDFHPWKHDNRTFLKRLPEVVETVGHFSKPASTAAVGNKKEK